MPKKQLIDEECTPVGTYTVSCGDSCYVLAPGLNTRAEAEETAVTLAVEAETSCIIHREGSQPWHHGTLVAVVTKRGEVISL